MQTTLPKPLRTQLENTVKSARDIAETAARAALQQLAVGEGRLPDYLNDAQRVLRRRLRAHGRSLGDAKHGDDTQELRRLVWEVAYEHWHRMLFARFLAENGLLLWEPGAAVSLQDCREMVDHHPEMAMGARSEWELAGKLAARMLPQVFKPQHPVFELVFAPEHQRELERLLGGLPPEVFQASDSLGWVYQFWQARRKDEVNASEVKIGADELPAVTQLFTEPYMVDFLLHNSLGAWWLTRHPDTPCPVPLTYLRTLEDGTPAAGKFEGWPDTLADFKLLDPCCGSGHFLVAAFLMLVPMRMAAEHLSAREAVDAVLRDNLHGLELDPRCVEIAVFALALAAWRFPDEAGQPLGVRADMPAPNIACCGLKVAARAADWMALVPDEVPNAAYLRQELRLLHDSFSHAPLLGSLLDPARSLKNDLATTSFDTLRDLLGRALATECFTASLGQTTNFHEEVWDLTLTARGLVDAARLLGLRYNLVITNPPYLASGKHAELLKSYCENYYPDSRSDLATVFIERCIELCEPQASVQLVLPHNWLFLGSYRKLRRTLLGAVQWDLLAWMGKNAFQTPLNVSPILFSLTRAAPSDKHITHSVDVSDETSSADKGEQLANCCLTSRLQRSNLEVPDARILSNTYEASGVAYLEKLARSGTGIQSFDMARFFYKHWEIHQQGSIWEYSQSTVQKSCIFGGCQDIFRWEQGQGALFRQMEALRETGYTSGIWRAGSQFWGRLGVAVSLMGELPCSLYLGTPFDKNTGVLMPERQSDLPALWAFCEGGELSRAVREIDQSLKVTSGTLVKVAFDVAYWAEVARQRYPEGLPKPISDDPTQWLFHGHPQPATDPLQVAVARLLGYRWPAETDAGMELADEARQWIAHTAKLAAHADDDGIVCLPAVRGEKPAHERLLALLIDAWETVTPGSWKASTLDRLLAEADCVGKGLEVWLRERFFEQHAKRFHHRPFIWHVWDGLKDGFGALVNYHKLDARNLERLIHTYLGDWIRIQEAGVASGLDGAPQRLAAAQALKKKLEAILEGEAPHDIFVRWKPLAEQPIGWNPDLNDGVRLNIRPWMTAGVLRHNKGPKLNIKWDKDRGKDVESAPWFAVFKGDRINDHHLTLSEKRSARQGKQ